MRVTVFGEQREFRATLEEALYPLGLTPTFHATLAECLRRARVNPPDLIVAHVGRDLSLLKQMIAYKECSMSGRSSLIVVVPDMEGVDLLQLAHSGVNDFLCEPFTAQELRARVQRVLASHQQCRDVEQVAAAGHVLQRSSRTAVVDDRVVRLTFKEFELAWMLFRDVGQLVSKQQIASVVWGASSDISERTIETHVYNLRRKLGLGEGSRLRLRSVYSLGYRLEAVLTVEDERDPPLTAGSRYARARGHQEQGLSRV